MFDICSFYSYCHITRWYWPNNVRTRTFNQFLDSLCDCALYFNKFTPMAFFVACSGYNYSIIITVYLKRRNTKTHAKASRDCMRHTHLHRGQRDTHFWKIHLREAHTIVRTISEIIANHIDYLFAVSKSNALWVHQARAILSIRMLFLKVFFVNACCFLIYNIVNCSFAKCWCLLLLRLLLASMYS